MRIQTMLKSQKPGIQTLATIFVIGFALSVGCDAPPDIAEYKIPKTQSGLEALREPERPSRMPVAAMGEKRMVVAIFENADATWFFKINGPKNVVDASEDKWHSVIDSVSFEAGEPKWKAESWKTLGPKPFRHATLVVPETDPPLELAISSLGPDQDLLLNANRWLGQLSLPNATQDDLKSLMQSKDSGVEKYLLFEAIGKGSGQMTPPFAGGGNAPFAGNSAPFAGGGAMSADNPSFAGTPPPSKLKYDAPEGWTEGKTSSIVHARFSKNSDDAKAQITVTEMALNEWQPNAERWMEQVGLTLDAEQIAARTKTISIDGTEGKLIDLVSDSDKELGTFAAMVNRDGSTWFIKIMGNRKMVEENQTAFDEFLDSISYK